MWVKPWISNRTTFGAYYCLLKELESSDQNAFRNFGRMDKGSFDFLLERISPLIEKKDTMMRDSIPAAERLAVTLRYLASGDSYASLEYLFRIPKSTLSKIIPETCESIYEVLKEFIKVPQDTEEWRKIAEGFQQKWNFPNCIGALDGKHVMIQNKRQYGSTYFNYKHFNSIILFALVDAECNFIYIDVGTNGRVSDSTVFSKSTLFGALENSTLNLPEPTELPGRLTKMPFVIVADEAFPLKSYLMKPFPSRDLTQHRRIFNYRLSRARRTVENAFGILSSRFRILQHSNPLDVDKVKKVVMACCALHNFLRRTKTSADIYSPCNSFSTECIETGECVSAEWSEHNYAGFKSCSRQGSSFSSVEARQTREEYLTYFNSSGMVPWQNHFV